MSLSEFDHAEVREGHLYELGRGVIVVSDVPKKKHRAQVTAIRNAFVLYQAANPGKVYEVLGGAECKILVPGYESERHPDVAVYTVEPPAGEDIWSDWVPAIAVEVISPGSEKRDYEEKAEEYLAFGVMDYLVFNVELEEVALLHRSGGRWARRILAPTERYTTHLLPGFALDVATVFAAARAAGS